jgi:NAD(P)-dependent dehydrogenase (short-subunit alcohol dehydrogenase family)
MLIGRMNALSLSCFVIVIIVDGYASIITDERRVSRVQTRMTTASKVAVVVGVGPGLGRALAVRFARGGFRVALVARHDASLADTQEEIVRAGGSASAFLADAGDEDSVRATFERIHAELGPTEVLLYNAGGFELGGILELSAATVERVWRTSCLGGLFAAQAVVPGMLAHKRGTVIFSGATASLRGSARFAAIAIGKVGLRALAQSLAREFGPQGIHVAHVVIDGQIDSPRVRARFPDSEPQTLLNPAAIAETYWSLYAQDASAWTHEIDLRPAVEKF